MHAVNWMGEFMKEKYCSCRLKKLEQENDPWPPVKIKSYVTLALMYQKDLQTHKATTQTIHLRTKGDILNIPRTVNSQKITDLTQIFSFPSGGTPTTILIEGQPGIGKTTLVKKICIEWAEGKLLTSDKLVLLLLLRDPNVQKITNVQQLIEHFIKSTSKVTQLQDYLEDNHGKDVTFIIDGFDELSSELRKRSFFKELIQKEVFTKSRIVVTSRPSASICLHNIVDTRIEVLGFDQTSKMEYASDALQDAPLQLENLHKHLQQYPKIDAMCYIPLVMSIIVFLCICQEEELPPTACKMYRKFVLHTICHYLKRTGAITEEKPVNKMEHLPQAVQQVLHELERVAFCSLIKDIIVFTESDLPAICRDDPTCYGLLQSVQCYSENDAGAPLNSFNFLHLGIQEYFAAKYVTTLPEDEVYTLLKESFLVDYSDNDSKSVRLSNMWIMYCGIKHGQCKSLIRYLTALSPENSLSEFSESLQVTPTTTSSNVISEQLKIVHSTSNVSNSSTTVSFPVQLSYVTSEKQQKKYPEYNDYIQGTCSTSDRKFISVMTEHKSTSSSSGMPSISQEIFKNPVNILYLFHCFQESEDETLHGLLSNIFDSGVINVSRYTLYPHLVISLGFFLSKSNRIWKELDLSSCHLQDSGICVLHQYICNKNTKHKIKCARIDLRFNCLSKASSHFILDIITYLEPHSLLLGYNNIGNVRGILTAAINTVKVLDLSGCRIPMEEILPISEMMVNMEELHISSNDLCEYGAIILSEGIAKIETQVFRHTQITNRVDYKTRLDLSENQIENPITSNTYNFNDMTITTLRCLTQSTTLTVLDIHSNKIAAIGATAIAMSLSYNTSLEVLNMNNNFVGPKGAKALANAIANNSTLKELHVSYNRLCNDGAVMLLGAVAKNTALRKLDISCNNIRDLGAIAIAKCLLENNSLEALKMGYNEVDKDGATAMANGIISNKTLKKLSLTGDIFCNSSTAMSNHMIGYLDDRDINLVTQILKSLHCNTTITELELPSKCDSINKEIEAINNKRKIHSMQNLLVHYEIDIDQINECCKLMENDNANASISFDDLYEMYFGDDDYYDDNDSYS